MVLSPNPVFLLLPPDILDYSELHPFVHLAHLLSTC